MTDDRLIELLQQRPPEDLSGDELAGIRNRLAGSAALREAMLGQLQLEQALHQTVAQFRLPVELLLAKAAAIQATSTVAKLFGWGSVTALVIGVASVGTLVSLRGRDKQEAIPPAAVDNLVIDEPRSPSDLEPRDATEVSATNGQGDTHAELDHSKIASLPAEQFDRAPAAGAEVFFADSNDAAAWRQSLEPVVGGVSQRTVDERVELVVRGTQVLQRAWPAAGRMRLKLAEHDRFKIHLSRVADEGGSIRAPSDVSWPGSPSSLTLEFFAQPQPLWVAWLAARRASQTVPQTLALAAHDQGRLSRLGAGTVDVGYHHGRILLTHGETELLSAPLAGPPNQIVFEGEAVIHGLAFAEGLIATSERTDVPADSTPPAERQWRSELPVGAQWNVLAEGRVELLAEDSQADAYAACAFDGAELREIVFQLEDPLPGTGIYLGDDQGTARDRLGFMAGGKPNRVCFALATDDHLPQRLPAGPLPLCPPRPWFKLITSEGVVKAWFSCDGAYWSPVLGPELAAQELVSTAGVYCLAGPGTRSIRVARLAAVKSPNRPPPAYDLFGQSIRGRGIIAMRLRMDER